MSKEFWWMILLALISGYIISFPLTTQESWIIKLGIGAAFAFSLLLLNLIGKKIAASVLDCHVEMQPWTIHRYGMREKSYFRRPFPAWLIFPIAIVFLSFGYIRWLANYTFELDVKKSRIRHRYQELTEWDFALIAASGIALNIVAAVILAAAGEYEYAKTAMWFVFYNMLPFPAFDGGKMFFGGMLFYIFMFALSIAILILIGITGILTTIIAAVLIGIIAIFVLYALLTRPLSF